MRLLLAVAVLALSCKAQQPPPAAAPSAPRAAAPSAPAASSPAGPPVKEIIATAKGFEPAVIEVAGGQPVVLRFTRKSADTCADAVDIEGDPVRHMLPLDVPVEVKVTPPASGRLTFACPMRMYRGALVVMPK